MPEVAFVMSARQPYSVRELAVTLGQELELQAVPCTLHLGAFPEPRPSLLYVLLDPEIYIAYEGEESLPDPAILRRTIFVCTEPPSPDVDEEPVALLRRAAAVFVFGRRRLAAMHRRDIPARLISQGYSKALDRFNPAAPRPIDVLFLGTHGARRAKYLSRAGRVLSRHNCVLHVCEDIPTAAPTDARLAEARWPLLTQAKVLISIHPDEQARFDWAGALDAIHAGAVVATELSGGMAPLVAGEHLVATSADSLPYVVEHLLGDEQRLARLRSGAYERLKAWMPYALSVAVLRAAVVELVGEPVPSGATLGRPRVGPDAADAAVPAAGPPHHATESEPRLREVRRLELVHESLAWGSRRAPCVTVVVTPRGGDEAIAATLDSVAHSSLKDFELVLVDRWDSEQTRLIGADWMAAHPEIASRLVLAGVSGEGAARNIGLELARGAFVLILAPVQELYPRCLDVLTGTLAAMPEVAFAYPMQEVTGPPNGDYLLSYLEWDPERARSRNDIHAPALIRSESLRRVGGFATNPRLAGLEDHDLWCRLAERGWPGRLVPEVLARRGESAGSLTLPVPQP